MSIPSWVVLCVWLACMAFVVSAWRQGAHEPDGWALQGYAFVVGVGATFICGIAALVIWLI